MATVYHLDMNRRPDRRKHHIIYRTTCTVTGKFYVGMHSTDNLNDGYIGSGVHLRRSIAKHGASAHVCVVIEECPNRAALVKRELEIVNDALLKDPLCMNLVQGGLGGAEPGERNSFYGRRHTPETIEKISASMKGERGPCYGRTGDKHPMFGKHHTAEASKKMSTAHAGKPLTKTHVESIRRGHAKNSAAIKERDAQILSMLDACISRQEIVDHLGVKLNEVYGASYRRKMRSAHQANSPKDGDVVVGERRRLGVNEDGRLDPPDDA